MPKRSVVLLFLPSWAWGVLSSSNWELGRIRPCCPVRVLGCWGLLCTGRANVGEQRGGLDTTSDTTRPSQPLPQYPFPKRLLEAFQKSQELSVVIVTDPLLLNWP